MNLLPSLKDGCLYSASFDILQDMFLRFSDILGFTLTSELTVMGEWFSGKVFMHLQLLLLLDNSNSCRFVKDNPLKRQKEQHETIV